MGRAHARAVVALGAVVWLVYANGLGGDLVSDSRHVVLEDPRVRAATWEHVALVFGQDYWWPGSVKGLYRPLTTLTYLANYTLLGNAGRPAGYHVVNVLLHWTNAALVYALALRLLARPALAVATALLFVAHPVGSEVVTNVVGRADLLATLAVLAGVVLWIDAAAATGRARVARLAGVGVVTAAGLLAKESAVVLVGAIVVHDVVYPPRDGVGAAARRWLVLVPPVVGVWALRAHVFAGLPAPYVSFLDNPLVRADAGTRVATAVGVLARYVALLAWPATLSCDYSYAQIPLARGPLDAWTLAGAATLVTLGIVALRARRSAPALTFFVLFAVVGWLPVSNVLVTIGTVMGERLVYLPWIGLAGAVVVAAHALALRVRPGRADAATATACALVACALGARTVARNADWHDSVRLWTAAVRAAPRSFKTHLALAEVLFAAGSSDGARLDRVIRETELARAIVDAEPLPAPDRASLVPLDLGLYYRLRGDALDGDEARAWYERSREALLAAAEIDRAVNEETRETEQARGRPPIDVGNYAVYQQLGVTLVRLERWDEAIAAFRSMRHLAPNLPASHVNLARGYLATGATDDALVSLLAALALDERDDDVRALAVDVYRRSGGSGCGVVGEDGAARLDPACPAVRERLCRAYGELVRLYGDAHQEARAAPFEERRHRLGCR